VFDVMMVPGRLTASTLASNDCLISICSITASIIQSTSPTRARSPSNPPVLIQPATSAEKKGSGFSWRARFSPSLAIWLVKSSSNTETPAFAKCAAICAPIVPAPKIATD
jgi:hypothetical protein